MYVLFFFFFSSRRRHTRFDCDWSSDVCSSDLVRQEDAACAALDDGRGDARILDVGEGLRGEDDADVLLAQRLEQIGRAACRGRGEISGVAGSFKKKKKKIMMREQIYKRTEESS